MCVASYLHGGLSLIGALQSPQNSDIQESLVVIMY